MTAISLSDGPSGGPGDSSPGTAVEGGTPSGIRHHKRPESVLVVVYTRGGEFLMLRRTWPPDFWQSITGSLKEGESARHAAVREVGEESGLEVSPLALVDMRHTERFQIPPAWRARYAPGAHYNREHWFALCISGHRSIRLNPTEHLESRWLSASRAAAIATSWTNRKAIQTIAVLSSAWG